MAQNRLHTSPAPAAELALSLCGEEGIEFSGQKFVPDGTKGYFTFKFSHAFPVSTVYGTALHPDVIAASYRSLLHQNVNYEHQIAEYHKASGRDVRDRIVGSIVAVDFPQQPFGGWKISKDSETPGISGVAVVYKQSQGMADIMGQQLAGRRQYTVSMEVLWPFDEAGFIVELARAKDGKGFRDPAFNFTPTDLLTAGFEYVPTDRAPEDLLATFNRKKERIVSQWKGRKVCILMGGLKNPVHYAGAGVVQFGAERTAKIQRLAASKESASVLSDVLDRALSKLNSI